MHNTSKMKIKTTCTTDMNKTNQIYILFLVNVTTYNPGPAPTDTILCSTDINMTFEIRLLCERLCFNERYSILRLGNQIYYLDLLIFIVLEWFIFIVYPDLYFYFFSLISVVILHFSSRLYMYKQYFFLRDVYNIWHYASVDLISCIHGWNKDWINVYIYFFYESIVF